MNQTSFSAEQLVVDVALAALKESLATVIRFFQLVVEGGPDHVEQVHQLRVSTRRAGTALEVFEDFLPRRSTSQLRHSLSMLRKQAGVLRDADVFAAKFASLPESGVAQVAGKKLDTYRTEGQAALNELYEKWERGEHLERLATDVLCKVRPRRAQADRANESFRGFSHRCLRCITRRFFGEHETEPKSLKRMHAFRIRTKGLRYSLELLEPGLPEDRFAKAYSLVKKLAQRLGDINDHSNAEQILEALLREADEGRMAESLEQCLDDERQALGESLARFKKWWSRRKQRRLRRRLKRTAEWRPTLVMQPVTKRSRGGNAG